MGRYETILHSRGKNYRERIMNRTKNSIERKAPNSGSYKETVLINGESIPLVIDSGTKPYYKDIVCYDNNFYVGDKVEWANAHWLILTADNDNELYTDGTMQQCNYLLKWQNGTGEILEDYVVLQDATAYNTGLKDTKLTTIGYDQNAMYIQMNEETLKLRRGKRFFIDNDTEDPTAYIVTKVDNISNYYNEHGYIILFVTEDQVNEKVDNRELMICDYFNPNEIIEIGHVEIKQSSTYLRCGYKNGISFTPLFYNDEGDLQDNVIPKWNVLSEIKDKLEINEKDGMLTIKTYNQDTIEMNVTVELQDESGLYPLVSKTIQIKGLF